MKAQPKAVFLLLATFAAYASGELCNRFELAIVASSVPYRRLTLYSFSTFSAANVLTGTIRGKHELSAQLEDSGDLEESSSFDAVDTVPDQIAGLEEDEDSEDYDDWIAAEDYDDFVEAEEDEDYDDEEEDEPKEVEETNLIEEGRRRRVRFLLYI